MRLSALIASAALICLGGCASLDVRVDVLKPSHMAEITLDQGLRIEAVNLVSNDTSERIRFIAAQKQTYRTYRAACYDRAADEAAKLWPAPTAGAIRESLNDAKTAPGLLGEIDILFAPMASELAAIDARTRAEVISPRDRQDAAGSEPMPSDLKAALLTRRNAYVELVADFYANQRNQCARLVALYLAPPPAAPVAPATPVAGAPAVPVAPAGPATADAAAQQLAAGPAGPALAEETQTGAANANAAAQRVITGGGVLLLDRPEAWAVVSAPDNAWAEHFNRARVTGVGGGTDIAITMNSTGDYSVKGFTFDGRATANMVSKVGGQALRLVAAAYGAPIPGPQPAPGATPAPSGGYGSVVADEATLAAAAEESAAYRAALFRIADTILARSDDLIDGDVSSAAPTAALIHLQAWRTPPEAPGAAQ